jgi:hypothetical protein
MGDRLPRAQDRSFTASGDVRVTIQWTGRYHTLVFRVGGESG